MHAFAFAMLARYTWLSALPTRAALNQQPLMLHNATNLTPGEIVLGFRLRSCFPARLADKLPKTDEALVLMVRNATKTAILNSEKAKAWLMLQFVTQQGFEDTEPQLMLARIGGHFQ